MNTLPKPTWLLACVAALLLTTSGCDGGSGFTLGTSPGAEPSGTDSPWNVGPQFPDSALPPGLTSDERQAPGSFITSLQVDLDSTAGFDLDGDGSGNNAVGALFAELESLVPGASVNAQMASAISNGTLAIGLLWPGLDPDALSPALGFEVFVTNLEDPDGDPETQLVFGAKASPVEAESWPGTPMPGASFVDGMVTAGPGPLPLAFPLFGVTLDLEITKAWMSGTAEADSAGISVPDGTFFMVVDMGSVVEWMNDLVSSPACACVKGLGDMANLSKGFTQEACNGSLDTSACTGEGVYDGTCAFFVDGCRILLPIVDFFADLDTTGDGVPDAHSAVMRFEASGAQITVQ